MTDPWVRRCPAGHTNPQRRGDRVYCYRCDQYYEEAVDARQVDGFPTGVAADD
jgi:hypothetical protein